MQNSLEHIGNGVNDDSTYIQKAIDYIASLYNTKASIVNTIDFSAGIYLLEQQVKLYNFVKFNSVSNVIIRSKVSNKATLLLSSSDLTIEDKNALSKYQGKWISGEKGGFTLEYVGEKTGNDIGIQINEESNKGGIQYFTAWQNFGFIVVKGFTKGLYLYMKNLYLNAFDNLIFTKCTRCFETSVQIENAGEKIEFNNCIFGDSEEVGLVQSSDLELVFRECSFDFVGKGIRAVAAGVVAKFSQCHAEGIGFTNQLVEFGYNPYLFCTDANESVDVRVFVDECDCMSIRSELFKSTKAKAMKLFLNSMTTKRKSRI